MRRRILVLLALVVLAACGPAPIRADDSSARFLLGAPVTLDPAELGDADSAAITAQLYETLTTFDGEGTLRPALAESWTVEDGGRRVRFRLRPDLTFSDGTPLLASDVVRSWLRVIDPAAPSPLSTLLLDVDGAAERLAGMAKAEDVGLVADDAERTITVTLARPTADFVSIAASPPLGVVPPAADGGGDDAGAFQPGDEFVGSGGYRAVDAPDDRLVLEANPSYWAGPPAIGRIEIVSDLAGASAVEAFEDRQVDYAPISEYDAGWAAYDATLGPQLRQVASMSTDYYGFDTTRAPFDDVRIRQAFAAAVDWRRIARLALSDPSGVATSMVPPGIPGRSDRDVVPPHDPERARALLAEAGYPGGAGFPAVTLMTGGSPYDAAVVTELERELDIDVVAESDFDTYFDRLEAEPPQMWFLSWVADYPGRNDFLGVLLGSGATNNYGGWSSPEFDAAIADAGAAADPAAASAAYDRAEDIVGRDAPVVPVSYGTGWALARDGLLGAAQNGMGIIRMAGLAWAD
jgi:oligopeptide transport system substrate-binding protein